MESRESTALGGENGKLVEHLHLFDLELLLVNLWWLKVLGGLPLRASPPVLAVFLAAIFGSEIVDETIRSLLAALLDQRLQCRHVTIVMARGSSVVLLALCVSLALFATAIKLVPNTEFLCMRLRFFRFLLRILLAFQLLCFIFYVSS